MKKTAIFLLLIPFLLLGCQPHTGSTTSIGQDSSVDLSPRIETNLESIKVLVNKKAQLIAEVYPKDYQFHQVLYEIQEGDGVFSVDNNGVITGLSIGTGRIAVKIKNSKLIKEIPVTVVGQEGDVEQAFPIAPLSLTNADVFGQVNKGAPAIGNQKILVIPVHLYGCDDDINPESFRTLDRAYNYTIDSDGWLSIKEYYRNASNGLLNYDAIIADQWYEAPETYTVEYLKNNYPYDLVPYILQWYQQTYPDVDMSIFDEDNDGAIDNIHFIHNSNDAPFNTGLWPHVNYAIDNVNTTGLKVNRYAWFPLSNISNIYHGTPEGGVTTCIVIHENGHLLGLVDYYDAYSTGMDTIGYYDMQSGNYLDWNSFSKYSVGWAKPHYVNEDYLKTKRSATLTISSSALDADCLIIRNKNWKGNPFDEYIMIELFNPDAGNNYYDARNYSVPEIGDIGFGVRIYHVDARICQVYQEVSVDETTMNIFSEVLDSSNVNRPNWTRRNYFNDNNARSKKPASDDNWHDLDTDGKNYYLLHLLQKGGENTFTVESKKTRNTLNSSDLWQTGDTFTIGKHEGYYDYGENFFYKKNKLNDNSDFPYGITFDEVTPNTATMTIAYLGE